jgi:hypothetical protein
MFIPKKLFGVSFLVLAALLALMLVTPVAAQIDSSSFSLTGSMGTARDSHTATLLANGKVLVAGGKVSHVFAFLVPLPFASAEL